MIKKSLITLIIIVILLLTMSGCWSRTEPKELAIITSLIYDINENNDYNLTIEYLDPIISGKGNMGSGKPTYINVAEGKTIPQALNNSSLSICKQLFGGNNKARLFTEKFASRNLTGTMDYFLREHGVDERPLLLVIKGEDPKTIYDSSTGLTNIVGSYIETMEKSQLETTSLTVYATTLQFIKDTYNEGKQPVMGLIEIVPNEAYQENSGGGTSQSITTIKKNKVKFEGLAAFKDNKLIGYMDGKEARAYNFLTNNAKVAHINTTIDSANYEAILAESKAKIKTRLEDNIVFVDVSIKAKIYLIQAEGNTNPSEIEDTKIIEKAFSKMIKTEIYCAVNKAQTEFNSDIFGFGSYFHSDNPEEWKLIKDEWDDEYFARAIINVKVESDLSREGEIGDPFGRSLNE